MPSVKRKTTDDAIPPPPHNTRLKSRDIAQPEQLPTLSEVVVPPIPNALHEISLSNEALSTSIHDDGEDDLYESTAAVASLSEPAAAASSADTVSDDTVALTAFALKEISSSQTLASIHKLRPLRPCSVFTGYKEIVLDVPSAPWAKAISDTSILERCDHLCASSLLGDSHNLALIDPSEFFIKEGLVAHKEGKQTALFFTAGVVSFSSLHSDGSKAKQLCIALPDTIVARLCAVTGLLFRASVLKFPIYNDGLPFSTMMPRKNGSPSRPKSLRPSNCPPNASPTYSVLFPTDEFPVFNGSKGFRGATFHERPRVAVLSPGDVVCIQFILGSFRFTSLPSGLQHLSSLPCASFNIQRAILVAKKEDALPTDISVPASDLLELHWNELGITSDVPPLPFKSLHPASTPSDHTISGNDRDAPDFF